MPSLEALSRERRTLVNSVIPSVVAVKTSKKIGIRRGYGLDPFEFFYGPRSGRFRSPQDEASGTDRCAAHQEKLERIKPVPRRAPTSSKLTATTEEIALLTRVRRSRRNASSDGTCFESTLGVDASEIFPAFGAEEKFSPPCFRR